MHGAPQRGRDVRRVADEDVEVRVAKRQVCRVQHVVLRKGYLHLVGLCVGARDSQGSLRNVGGKHLRLRQVLGQCDGDAAAAGAHVPNAQGGRVLVLSHDEVHQFLGFRSRNQHVGSDFER